MRAVLVWVFICFSGAAGAQALSEAVLKQVREDPEPFLQLAADLIHGFGGPGGIDAAGVGRFVALERAEARASALRRIAVADLDFDGAVTAEEFAVLAAAASAKSRGRLWAVFERADASGDRVVSPDEAAVFARDAAMHAFGPADEAVARAVLTFDGNADGWVSLDEVKAAVAALAT
jgi:hypothetical protein